MPIPSSHVHDAHMTESVTVNQQLTAEWNRGSHVCADVSRHGISDIDNFSDHHQQIQYHGDRMSLWSQSALHECADGLF